MDFLKKYYFAIIVILLIGLRFYNLEQDLPSGRIICHSDADQYHYTRGALNYFHDSSFRPIHAPENSETRNLIDTFENIWTAFFLKILGNNLFGMKIPVVILSLISILLMYLTLIKMGINKSVIKIVTLFLLSEFMFFESSRLQSPTVYSFFGCALLIYSIVYHQYCLVQNKKDIALFFIGFVAVFNILGIYIFNLFLILALGISVLIYFIFFKKEFKAILLMAAGATICVLILTFLTNLLFNESILDLYNNLQHFNNTSNFRFLDVASLPLKTKIIQTIACFFTINFLRFNLFLFVILSPCLIYFFNLVFQKRQINILNLFIIFSLVFAFAQMWIEPVYSQRKFTTLMPIYLILIAYTIDHFLQNQIIEFKTKLLYLFFLCVGLLSSLYCYSITTASWSEVERFGSNTPTYLNYINIVVAFFFFAICVIYLFNKKIKKLIFYGFICLIFIPSLSFNVKYVILNDNYTYLNSMKDLTLLINNKKIGGDLSEPLLLYNNIKIKISPHFYSNDSIYKLAYIDYLEKDSIQVLNLFTDSTKLFGYGYDKTIIPHTLLVGDTLLVGNKFYLLVDKIANLNQGKKLYVGIRHNKKVNY